MPLLLMLRLPLLLLLRLPRVAGASGSEVADDGEGVGMVAGSVRFLSPDSKKRVERLSKSWRSGGA